jgi:TRAP transporter TAXI family solute receptor
MINSLHSRREVLGVGAGATAASFIGAPAIAQPKLRMTIVTGGAGGVFYPYGGGLAKILSEKGAGIQATAQVTGGSVDNCKLVAAGDAEIGFATLDSAYDATMGADAYAKEGKLDIKVLAVLYDSFLHVVADARAGVGSILQMKGKRIGVGSSGSSTESITDRVLQAGGLDPKKDITRDNLGVAESANALKDGKIAAFFWIGGIPTAAVRDLATSGQPAITFVPTAQEHAALERYFPGLYRANTLKGGSYAGQSADVAGLGVANVLVVSGKTKDETVTAMLNAVFNNLADVQAIHPEARRLTLQGAAAKSAVPFHPAAAAFYKSKGVAG